MSALERRIKALEDSNSSMGTAVLVLIGDQDEDTMKREYAAKHGEPADWLIVTIVGMPPRQHDYTDE